MKNVGSHSSRGPDYRRPTPAMTGQQQPQPSSSSSSSSPRATKAPKGARQVGWITIVVVLIVAVCIVWGADLMFFGGARLVYDMVGEEIVHLQADPRPHGESYEINAETAKASVRAARRRSAAAARRKDAAKKVSYFDRAKVWPKHGDDGDDNNNIINNDAARPHLDAVQRNKMKLRKEGKTKDDRGKATTDGVGGAADVKEGSVADNNDASAPSFSPSPLSLRQLDEYLGVANDNNDNTENTQEQQRHQQQQQQQQEDAPDKNTIGSSSSANNTMPMRRNNGTIIITPPKKKKKKLFSSTPNNGGFTDNCERVAGDEFLAREWRKSKREVCRVNNSVGDGDTVVTEHLLAHLDAKPSFRFYENMFMESYTGNFMGTNCPRDTTYLVDPHGSHFKPPWIRPLEKPTGGKGQKNKKKKTLIKYGYRDPDLVLVRLVRFHLGNIYEAMHGYVNSYLMMRAFGFDQTKIQFAFEDKRESTLRDDQFWNSFSLNTQRPIYRYAGKDGLQKTRVADNFDRPVLARRVVQGFSTGISVLVSSAAPLSGRGKDHPCSSSWTQNATRWMRRNFERIGLLPPLRSEAAAAAAAAAAVPGDGDATKRRRRVEVVWNSRQVHPRAGGDLLAPLRMIARETEFVLALRHALGPDVHVRVVDFAALDGPQSIRAAETANVMIGFHGAGMTWSMFMKPSDSAVIEFFGFSRPNSNRHYANIAKLMDFNYRSMTVKTHLEPAYQDWPVEGEKQGVHWDADTIREIQRLFFSLPWAVKLRRPCAVSE